MSRLGSQTRSCVLALLLAAAIPAAAQQAAAPASPGTPAAGVSGAPLVARNDLLDMSIEQLNNIRVTSVSRRPESLNDAASAVYVITGDEIRRAGVKTLAEALRLAPGVEVARDGAHSWTISIRGFSSNLSDKLLVLIDGRSVYSPLYAGVFWDVQDTLLDDIDRIEVIEGPGGTLWGANAVNGVVNIITRSAWETQGGYVDLASGDQEHSMAGFRYGGHLGSSGAIRGYVKYFDRAGVETPSGASDAWHMARAGFRADFDLSDTDTLELEGEAYSGRESGLYRADFTLGTLPGPDVPGTSPVSGNSVQGSWRRRLALGAGLRLDFYYDHTFRDIPGDFSERRDTLDASFQHNLAPLGRHELIWGLELRSSGDYVGNTLFSSFLPPARTDQTYSAFLQDKITLSPRRLFLTLGSKLEHNDYTGAEDQPNARLTWLPSQRQTFWAAASRAVRIPSRLEDDVLINAPLSIPGVAVPFYAQVHGNEDFQAEELLAYEAGYRLTAGPNLSFERRALRQPL